MESQRHRGSQFQNPDTPVLQGTRVLEFECFAILKFVIHDPCNLSSTMISFKYLRWSRLLNIDILYNFFDDLTRSFDRVKERGQSFFKNEQNVIFPCIIFQIFNPSFWRSKQWTKESRNDRCEIYNFIAWYDNGVTFYGRSGGIFFC